MADNLSIYEAGRAVPKEAQKAFSNGRFSGTDINPMWRIKKLTEMFGPCGIGWYTEVVQRHIIEASDGTKSAFIAVNLYIKVDGEWSKPIYGEGGNTFETKTKGGYVSVSDEAYKMAYTDALGIAAKALGIGADIWFANDREHGTKYDNKKPVEQPAQQTPSVESLKQAVGGISLADAIKEAETMKTGKEVQDLYKKYEQFFDGEERKSWHDACGNIYKRLNAA